MAARVLHGRAASRRRLRPDRRRRVPARPARLRRLGRRARRRAPAQRGRGRADAQRARRASTFSAGIAEFPRDARDQHRPDAARRGRALPRQALGPQPLRRLLLVRRRPALAPGGGRARPHRRPGQHRLRPGPRGRPQGRYTHQHSARVAQYAAVLAREFGMSEEEIDQIRTAGILHDVGKVGVADAVLLKPARLTDDEFLEMQRHSDARPRHRRGRGHARDRRVGALPARALGRPRLPARSSRATTSRSPAACSAWPTRSRR